MGGTDVSNESGNDEGVEDSSHDDDSDLDHDMSNSIKYNPLIRISPLRIKCRFKITHSKNKHHFNTFSRYCSM